MHSHHSHSGDYVSHAADTLEAITQKAVDMGFETFCLTEHQPRLSNQFLYPEEHDKSYSTEDLKENFAKYYQHAVSIRNRSLHNSGSATKFLVGFEAEAIDESHIDKSVEYFYGPDGPKFDMCVGSVHFVKSIPIDFDKPQWHRALEACGGVYELFDEYFELQYLMLCKLKPTVVGHFDLIKLMCDNTVIDNKGSGKKIMTELSLEHDWPKLWAKIIRNIEYVKSYGGLFELNSASIRKGWTTPYPGIEIARAIVNHGNALFCLSDDSHAVAQVGLNYHKVLDYAENILGLTKLYYVDLDDACKPVVKSKLLEEVKRSNFWKQYL